MMHHQLLALGGLVALATAERFPVQLHAPIKPRCDNHSDAPYPTQIGVSVGPVSIGTGGTAAPTDPSGTGPGLSSPTTLVGYGPYPVPSSNSTIPVGSISTGGSSGTANSPIFATSNTSSPTAGPTDPGLPASGVYGGISWSLPPFVPPITAGPISAGTAPASVDTAASSGILTGPVSASAPYGNGTTTDPSQLPSFSYINGLTLPFPTGTSPASTISLTETISVTGTFTSPFPTSNVTLSGTGVSSSVNGGITANVTSPTLPSHGPYTPASFPTASVTAPSSGFSTFPTEGASGSANSPTQASNSTVSPSVITIDPTLSDYGGNVPVFTSFPDPGTTSGGASGSANSPTQASNTTSPSSAIPIYPTGPVYTDPATTSIPASSYPIVSANTSSTISDSPIGASSIVTDSFEPTTFVTSTAVPVSAPDTTCEETTASTAGPIGASSAFNSTSGIATPTAGPTGASTAPILPTFVTTTGGYDYTLPTVSANVPAEYWHHHRRPHGRQRNSGFPWYEDGDGYGNENGGSEEPDYDEYDGDGYGAYE